MAKTKKVLEVRVERLESIASETMDILHRLDERMEHMDHIIRGNGAPGLVTKMEVLQQQSEEIRKSLAEAKETAKETAKTKSNRNFQWYLAAGSAILVEVTHRLLKR